MRKEEGVCGVGKEEEERRVSEDVAEEVGRRAWRDGAGVVGMEWVV